MIAEVALHQSIVWGAASTYNQKTIIHFYYSSGLVVVLSALALLPVDDILGV